VHCLYQLAILNRTICNKLLLLLLRGWNGWFWLDLADGFLNLLEKRTAGKNDRAVVVIFDLLKIIGFGWVVGNMDISATGENIYGLLRFRHNRETFFQLPFLHRPCIPLIDQSIRIDDFHRTWAIEKPVSKNIRK